jgi:hypothetical protein
MEKTGMDITDQDLVDTFQEGVDVGKTSSMQSLKAVLDGLKTKNPSNITQLQLNNILNEIWEKVEVEVF